MHSKLNIFVRQDLKMRKGKMAAQSAHSAQKLLIESMELRGEWRVLDKQNLRDFSAWMVNQSVVINMVKDPDALNASLDTKLPFAAIIDSGRTEFAGVPTLTCAAQGIFQTPLGDELSVPENYGQDIKAKQLYVFSKEYPLSKERACELATSGCLLYHGCILETISNDSGEMIWAALNVNPETEFGMWVSGAFAKIALGTATDKELFELEEILVQNGIFSVLHKIENNFCLVIEPKKPENIDPFTRHLSLI